jgi:c-di-GMP-binding flagellar brake protein YcgR
VHPRVDYSRQCKVFSAALQKYFLGETVDLSTGGMLIRIAHLVDVRPGDTLHIGVATKRREQLLQSADMLASTVIRSIKTVDDHTVFAVKFHQEQTSVEFGALRMAA